MRSNIWLKIGLYSIELSLIITAIFAPFTTYAGVFSFISDFIGNKEADAGVTSRSSEILGVLQANVGPSSTGGMGGGEISMIDGSALIQETGMYGTQADIQDSKSTQISLYVVRQGDSLGQIAKMSGVSVNTILWANNIRGAIHEGDELVILPISGVVHKVVKGDTIRSIAAKYKADMDDIISYNDLRPSSSLAVGSTIIIPDGESTVAAPRSIPGAAANPTEKLHGAGGPFYKDYYMRPIDVGMKTQGLHGYNAVDLAAPLGTPIHASASGVVIIARSGGYNGGYGSYVVISHPNGTQTLYGHMSRVSVEQGQTVEKGQTIGLLGSTGKSTGPHVHFEIRGAMNPF
ncbi:peptidoglycan DD-metalloendopeptidase family protein [Candidatus Parcubacteria bacterium]|nr:peptidoglycan DD-metalloendopeptidase family protein [Candidatus Parcubacteria bacterium]